MLSILIPTAGRGEVLPRLLRSIHRERMSVDHPVEVLVIDNNADEDLALQIQRQCASEGGAVRYARELSPGLTAARHRGAEEAGGDLLAYLDDDVELGRGWLGGILAGFADASIGIVGGPSIPRFTSSVPSWFWNFVTPAPQGGWQCGWVSLLDIGRAVADIDPDFIWGLNFGIRRMLLRELGGFHPDLVPPRFQRWQGDGETGLTTKAKAAGIKARYVPEAIVHHRVGPERLTQEYFARRARYQGICDSFSRIRAGHAPGESAPPLYAEAISPWHMAAAEVRRMTAVAYREGFEFHQREVSGDPGLLRWVRRETFWGADILAETATADGVT